MKTLHLFLFITLCTIYASFGQVTLLKDINTMPASSATYNLVESGNIIYFFNMYISRTGGNRIIDLWRSDGTVTGTYLLKNITQRDGGYKRYLTLINSTLYFFAGNELWKSDGTKEGTVKVKMVWTNSDDYSFNYNPQNTMGTNNVLYFAGSDLNNGVELWKSDGTESGTFVVKDIWTGTSSGNPRYLTNVNGTLYFIADDAENKSKLWKSDGTPAGTVMVNEIFPESFNSSISDLFNVDGKLFFLANKSELWRTDGTKEGTIKLKSSRFVDFEMQGGVVVSNGKLYFQAQDGLSVEFWKSDGTLTGTVKIKGIDPEDFTDVNGYIYFTKWRWGNSGTWIDELWKSDGTEAGTMKIKETVRANSSKKSINYLTNVKGVLYFSSDSEIYGNELWKSDGTETGTIIVKDIMRSSKSSSPQSLTNIKDQLYFSANDSIFGTELWKSDGTNSGTKMVVEVSPGTKPSYPSNFCNFNKTLFFSANDEKTGIELYKSDGTQAGTKLAKDIYAEGLTVVDDKMYFAASSAGYGRELWVYDKSGDAKMVKDIRTGTTSATNSGVSGTLGFISYKGLLYFGANDGINGHELWKSDGTEAGTVMVKDFYTGINSFLSEPNSGFPTDPKIKIVNNTLFFTADDGVHGSELWKSEGTESGTVMVKDICPGTGSSYIQNLTNVNGFCFFRAFDPIHGLEIWKSDGTAEGTVMIKDLSAGNNSPDIQNFTEVNGGFYFTGKSLFFNTYLLMKVNALGGGVIGVKEIDSGYVGIKYLTNVNGTLYFSSGDGSNGWALWKSDGTSSGTQPVITTKTGLSGYPQNLFNFNNTLYFTIGNELWTSDGTLNGTKLAFFGDLYISDPPNFMTVGDNLFFVGGLNNSRDELLVYHSTSTISEVFTNQNNVYIYPNPVEEWISIRGLPEKDIALSLYDITGRKVFLGYSVAGLNSFKVENISSGLYMYRIECEGSMFSGKLLVKAN